MVYKDETDKRYGRLVPMRSDEIKRALSKIYRSDQFIFLTEVKNGPTWFAGPEELRKVDALAIRKSWSKPCINAFEVKVSRSDFLSDMKWPDYLSLCHRFYWACPSGLIKPSEISPDCGLIWVSESGGCVTKKKALFRNIEIPQAMFYHIVISRLEEERHPFFSSQREQIAAWMEDKIKRYQLSESLKKGVFTKLFKLEDEVSELRRDREDKEEVQKELNEIREICRAHGISRWQIKDELASRLKDGIPTDFKMKVARLRDALDELV